MSIDFPSVFIVERIIYFKQLKGKSEWISQARKMIIGARWQFDGKRNFLFAPARGRKDIFPLKGDYSIKENKVIFNGITSISSSTSIANSWCFGEIDLNIRLPIMNIEWGNKSSTAYMTIHSPYNCYLISVYRMTIMLKQIFA